MAIIRWDPFRDVVTLREKMNRLFEDAVAARGEERDMITSSWSPAVDIYETESELVLSAEVPGIDEKDIEIKIEDNTLSIKGERKFEQETREENYHRIERSYGSFYRSFSLPGTVDQEHIDARARGRRPEDPHAQEARVQAQEGQETDPPGPQEEQEVSRSPPKPPLPPFFKGGIHFRPGRW